MLQGFNTHRLQENDPYHKPEIVYAESFRTKFGKKDSTIAEHLQKIVGGSSLSEREQRVALSVVQWLGTPVGQGFIEKVLTSETPAREIFKKEFGGYRGDSLYEHLLRISGIKNFLTDRELESMTAVIKWLETPEGFGFIKSAQKKI